MNQYKKIVCSFADSRLNNSLKRVKKQAEDMHFYDEIYVFNELSLDKEFRRKFSNHLVKGSRGYGYWCWKPQVVLQMFEKMEVGDVLQYIDSGCHLNPKGINRLRDYFEMSKMSDSGLLAFRSKNSWELNEEEKYYEHTERRYTKSDVLNHFGVLGNDKILDSTQYEAGNFFIRKDQENINFIKKWINIFSSDFRMIDDSPSVIPNEEAFIDHRHDQSLYSLLCKNRGVEELFTSEYFVEDLNWNKLAEFPIWVKRDKNFSLSARVEMFPKRVINYLKRKFRA